MRLNALEVEAVAGDFADLVGKLVVEAPDEAALDGEDLRQRTDSGVVGSNEPQRTETQRQSFEGSFFLYQLMGSAVSALAVPHVVGHE